MNQEKSKAVKSRSGIYNTGFMKSYCAQIGNVNAYVLFFQQRQKFLEMPSPPTAKATTAKAPVGTRTGFAQSRLERKGGH